MDLQTPQQQIELFHLIFLNHLGQRIDKLHYALKGGCNLRFYFKSPRYSEDIDLDVTVIAKDTLKSQVNKLLSSNAFQQVLKIRNLSIFDINPAKQTDTTQRWKLKIKGPSTSLPIPTKIEFSRRKMETSFRFESVDSELIANYQLYPVLANHYELDVALAQKIEALAYRTETQARDVFDISHLLGIGAQSSTISDELRPHLETAIENAISISYATYKSQVVSYLKEDYQDYFGTEHKWNAIQEFVIKFLEEAKKTKRQAL